MDNGTGVQPTVRGLLDTPLRLPRVLSLESACARLAARPLDANLSELRQAVRQPLSGEGRRRLHVFISTLYHRADAPLALTEQLRIEIEAQRGLVR
jgi:hypothetical protein